MALNDLLKDLKKKTEKTEIEVTKESLIENLDKFRELVAYWRVYPDRFIDFMCGLNPDNTFHFYFYQRMFLRILLRYKVVYAVFVRAWSKSFMSVLGEMVKCILYPGAKIFTAAGGKNQSATILSDKVAEICKLIPALEKEIIWDTRGTTAQTKQSKDEVIYTFKNGSVLRNVVASENARGQRFHSGLLEECVGIDQQILNEVLIPTMNISRRLPNGQIDDSEVLNKSSVFITTAGYKGTFSYDKLIEVFCQAVARPKKAFVLGGSWRVPMKEGLLDKNFVEDLKMDRTYNEASFEREYESKWSGDIESAFFSSDIIDRSRKVSTPEYEASGRIGKDGYYVLGVDYGRADCPSEVSVIKVTPIGNKNGRALKQLINLYTFDKEHTAMQALKLKRIYNRYKCRAVVVDGNGPGQGLVDTLVIDQTDPETGEILYGWGVINDDKDLYKPLETENTIKNLLYIMKANPAINSECYSYCQSEFRDGRIRLLIPESLAKERLLEQSQGQKMNPNQRANYLMPFMQTNILKEQMIAFSPFMW